MSSLCFVLPEIDDNTCWGSGNSGHLRFWLCYLNSIMLAHVPLKLIWPVYIFFWKIHSQWCLKIPQCHIKHFLQFWRYFQKPQNLKLSGWENIIYCITKGFPFFLIQTKVAKPAHRSWGVLLNVGKTLYKALCGSREIYVKSDKYWSEDNKFKKCEKYGEVDLSWPDHCR